MDLGLVVIVMTIGSILHLDFQVDFSSGDGVSKDECGSGKMSGTILLRLH